MCCLSFNIWLLIIPLISSNFLYSCFNLTLNVECDWRSNITIIKYIDEIIIQSLLSYKVNLESCQPEEKTISRGLTTWYIPHMKVITVLLCRNYYKKDMIKASQCILISHSDTHKAILFQNSILFTDKFCYIFL